MPVRDDAIAGLNAGDLVALRDTHSTANARALAQDLIANGYVTVFFIEYSSSAKTTNAESAATYGTMLNSAISEMLDQKLTEEQARYALTAGGYFARLSAADAAPSLLYLTAQCIGKGVQVLACDMEPDDVIASLDASDPAHAPFNEMSLFQPWGLAVRDQYTAQMVGAFLRVSQFGRGKLMLWGSDHFVANDERRPDPNLPVVPPLQDLLTAQNLTVDVLTP